MALLGGMQHVFGAPLRAANWKRGLDAELAAIAANPACTLTSLSVLAIRQGRVAYTAQFGHRTVAADGGGGARATARTMYRIASISKMMTTLALMRLVEQGKLTLDADAGEYLGFALRNPHYPERPISLRLLLSHTSSLRDDAGYSFKADQALRNLLVPGAPLYGDGKMWASNAAPGAFFTYSNLAWGVIGTIMERVTGERFDLLMRRLLLGPMGLRGGFNASAMTPAELADLATLYRKRTTDTEVWDGAGPWIAQVDDYPNGAPAAPQDLAAYAPGNNATPFSPTGGLRISAPDMGKVMLMLMNGGRHEGVQLLRPATLASMFERQWTYDGKNGDNLNGLFRAWGLGNQHFPEAAGGPQLVEGGGFGGVGHLGEAYGLYSVFVADLAKKNGIVVLVGGTSADPEADKGLHSSMPRMLERILGGVNRQALLKA
ncbi:serine hydrolase [Massilia glaciei]|uniref:Serine hydrolase n=2 Tax=Massilia glaciei TaxID=1524097 RepID=A0A2U2HFT1_9BURK|nr:serine hydrolase [Massilia glaciei]